MKTNDLLMDNNIEDYDIDYNEIVQQYDEYISDLIRKLQMAKEERKQIEMNTKQLEHRILLLNNQERLVFILTIG